jgi:hypothetical protein
MATLATVLDSVFPQVPEALMGRESRLRLAATASLLPVQLGFGMFGFECPLGVTRPGADLLVSARQARRGPALLLECASARLAAGEHGAWETVAALARRWACPPWDGRMDDVWLEFDIDGPAPRTPNVFLRPRGDGRERHASGHLLEMIGAQLLGQRPSARLRHSLHRCVEALPERARLFQMGAMRARAQPGFRLCINNIYLDRILAYLERIDYPANLQPVKDLCIWIQRFADGYALHVDLTPDVAPTIGIESYLLPAAEAADATARLQRWLRALTEWRLCTPAKAGALERYGGDITPLAQELAPRGLRRAELLSGRRSHFRRTLHHIKVTYRPEQPLEAKAYLAVQHQWRG